MELTVVAAEKVRDMMLQDQGPNLMLRIGIEGFG